MSDNNDFEKCKQLADNGDVEAQYQLGWKYSHGEGVELDYAEANELADKAKKMADDIRSESEDELE